MSDGVGAALRIVAVSGGLVAGLIAVYLARTVPPRMEVESRPRPDAWWATAVMVGGAFGWFIAPSAGWPLLPAFLVFGAATLALALIDLDHQLIPNRVLFPSLGIAFALLVVGAFVAEEAGHLIRGTLAGIAYFAFLLIVALIARGGFGMGDVKLALLLGLFLGYLGWDVLAVGAVLSVLLGGVASVFVLLFTGKDRRSKFAYGPYLVAGAWSGVFWGREIADWYLGTG